MFAAHFASSLTDCNDFIKFPSAVCYMCFRVSVVNGGHALEMTLAQRVHLLYILEFTCLLGEGVLLLIYKSVVNYHTI